MVDKESWAEALPTATIQELNTYATVAVTSVNKDRQVELRAELKRRRLWLQQQLRELDQIEKQLNRNTLFWLKFRLGKKHK